MLFTLFDGSFCVSVLQIKRRYDTSYCMHFMWNARPTFIDFFYSTRICTYRQYKMFVWLGFIKDLHRLTMIVVRTFCFASQEINHSNTTAPTIFLKLWNQKLDSQNIYFLFHMYYRSIFVTLSRKYFRFPHVLIFEIQTFCFEFQILFFEIQLNANSKV